MKLILIALFLVISSCSLFEKKIESPDQILDRVSHQKIFYAPYDDVWKAAHASVKYTIASENQDFGVIETDFVKAIDGWLPPFLAKPENPGSRYKLVLNFARGNTNGKQSVRVNIDKKIEVFRSVISDVDTISSDGLEEKMLFYRMEREIVIGQALRKAATANANH